jgi:putative intracellular protease/amidase
MGEWRAASPLKTASLAFAISRGLLGDIQRRDEARRRRLGRCQVRPDSTIAKTEETVMKVLMVITSHDQLGNTGRKTGFWLEELAAPYYVFKDAGVEITLASPKGGRPPIDPKSNEPDNRTELTVRFEKDAAAEAQLDKTLRLDSVRQDDFDTLFYPGGHGPMWDLAEDKNSIKLIESFIASGKTIGIVCHSTGALRHVKTPDGKPLVQGKEVTGFTNGEEEEIGLTKIVPFLVEDEMLKLGAVFSKIANWGVHVVSDGLLITGQNPHSSGPAAKTLLAAVKAKAKPAAARAS